jgi:hypothetical protein
MAHAEGRPRAEWVWVVPVAALCTCRAMESGVCVHDVSGVYDVPGSRVGRGAWAFEVRGGHAGAWCARGETITVYRHVSGTAECDPGVCLLCTFAWPWGPL